MTLQTGERFYLSHPGSGQPSLFLQMTEDVPLRLWLRQTIVHRGKLEPRQVLLADLDEKSLWNLIQWLLAEYRARFHEVAVRAL